MHEEIQPLAVLALDHPRAVTLKVKDRSFTYHLRHVTIADWLKYFASIVNQVATHDGEREELFDSDTAALELVESVLTSVDGYGDLSARKGWRQAIPLSHRRAIGLALRSVGAAKEQDDSPELCDLVTVRLDATWPTAEKTVAYSGLVHRFRQPSIQDFKRFRSETSRTKVRGDARDGLTIYPSAQPVAMKIYDESIESVDGYSLHGESADRCGRD